MFDITEFDYRGVNQVVYQENGVTIRALPAIHSLDGPLSLSVDYMVWNVTKDDIRVERVC
jgi:hypothetical protein